MLEQIQQMRAALDGRLDEFARVQQEQQDAVVALQQQQQQQPASSTPSVGTALVAPLSAPGAPQRLTWAGGVAGPEPAAGAAAAAPAPSAHSRPMARFGAPALDPKVAANGTVNARWLGVNAATQPSCRLDQLILMEQISLARMCVPGDTFGCAESNSSRRGMWARGGCFGRFRCGSELIKCGHMGLSRRVWSRTHSCSCEPPPMRRELAMQRDQFLRFCATRGSKREPRWYSYRQDNNCNLTNPVRSPASLAPPMAAANTLSPLLLASFLVNGVQKSNYRNLTHFKLLRMIDRLLYSRALADGLSSGTMQAHVVHDSPEISQPIAVYRGVVLHLLQYPVMARNGVRLMAIDARWAAYEQILTHVRPHADQCIFHIDLDVRVLRNFGALCQAHPQRLFVGSDKCSKGSIFFLRKLITTSLYVPSDPLARLIAKNSSHPYVQNAGIIGGAHWRVAPVMRALASRLANFYASRGAVSEGRIRKPIDMLVLNELMSEEHGEVMGGFPQGIVNLPMSGDTCNHEKRYCHATRSQASSARCTRTHTHIRI